MEKREVNVMINKVGGNAGSKSLNYRIAIPSVWAKELGVTPDNRKVKIEFDGKKIIIEKIKEEN